MWPIVAPITDRPSSSRLILAVRLRAAGNHHRARAGIVVTTITLVDVNDCEVDAAELYRLVDVRCKRVAIPPVESCSERFNSSNLILCKI